MAAKPARAVVNTLSEPVSNIAVPSGEDIATLGLLWVAYDYPTVAVGVTAVLLLLTLGLFWMAQRIVKRLFFRTPKGER
ncbi:MAG: DUF4126 family protein [Erythrobacter sp.]